MAITGLFREISYREDFDFHGGVRVKSLNWSYLCFVRNEAVGYYVSGERDIKSYFNFELLLYRGRVTHADREQLEFFVEDKFNDRRRYFKAGIGIGGSQLFVTEFDSDGMINANRDHSIFKKIDLDFETIAKTLGQVNARHTFLLDASKQPTDQKVFAGDEVEVLNSDGDYCEVKTKYPPSRTGWLRRSDIKFWSEP